MAISRYHAYQPMIRMWFTGRFLEEECDYLNKCPIISYNPLNPVILSEFFNFLYPKVLNI